MAKRIVRHAMLSYKDSTGVLRHALRGQTVELEGEQLERADKRGSVAPVDEAGAIAAAAPVVYPKDPVEVLAAAPPAEDTDEGDAPAKSSARRTRSSG
jgi:hypothetical protein